MIFILKKNTAEKLGMSKLPVWAVWSLYVGACVLFWVVAGALAYGGWKWYLTI